MEGTPEYLGEIEYSRGPQKAERNREEDEERYDHHLKEVVEPGHQHEGSLVRPDLGRMLHPVCPDHLVHLRLPVFQKQVLESYYHLKDRKLEYPPDIYLESHQHIADN